MKLGDKFTYPPRVIDCPKCGRHLVNLNFEPGEYPVFICFDCDWKVDYNEEVTE